ncbi:MAG TPA: protein-glutamate O-methyltransferase CheR [Candidatus Sulfotelmatobacter sp.]|nr:protein-glutamate O-methyltransferase CheR [Candidatus Sulfotelmatobacter sp.]
MIVEDRTLLALPEGTAQLLADLVQDYLGLYYDTEHLDAMLDRLTPLAQAHGCQSFLDYYYLLKYEGETREEWLRVMNALSVQETYFWREMDQIHSLVQVLVPQWFARTRQPLRIWSAACATGEEPFTIAMALAEAGWLGRVPIEIVGSDASVAALEKARRGIFRERSFRNLPGELRAKYFQPVPQGWCIAPELLVRVRFQRANLAASVEIAPLAKAPIIFCRNVFIYFSEQSIRRTVGCFAQAMPPEGHLFVGACESLLRVTQEFELGEVGNAFVYKNKARRPSPAGRSNPP